MPCRENSSVKARSTTRYLILFADIEQEIITRIGYLHFAGANGNHRKL